MTALPLIIGEGVIPETEAVRDVQTALVGRSDVVLLAHVAAVIGQPIPAGSTIYNLEPLFDGCRSLSLGYLDVLCKFPVWDYQRRNVEYLKALGIDALHVPYGYSKSLERSLPDVHKDIDVLFVGSMSQRRQKIIDDLSLRCNAVVAVGCYGKDLDATIARAKIVLNVHYCDSPHPLEVVRLNYLMANGCCVVSERGWEHEDNFRYAAGLIFSNDVVGDCLAWLEKDRMAVEVAALAAIRSMPMQAPLTREVQSCRG